MNKGTRITSLQSFLMIVSRCFLVVSMLYFVVGITSTGSIFDAWDYYHNTSEYIEDLYDNRGENPVSFLDVEHQKYKNHGYEFSLSRAMLLESNLYFTIHADVSLFNETPDGILYYITAIDSNGRKYQNGQRMNFKGVVGNKYQLHLTSCNYEMWISDVDTSADWIDLCYERFDKSFQFRINLK